MAKRKVVDEVIVAESIVESVERAEPSNYGHGAIKRKYSHKTIYVQDERKWQALAAYSERVGISQSEIIFRALESYMNQQCATCQRVSELLIAQGACIAVAPVKKGGK